MSIPIITIPEQGKILSRPRFEPLYDSEGWDDGSAIDPVINIFKDSTAFANTNLGATKTYGRDVNLDAVSGLSIGQSFQFYGLSKKIRTYETTAGQAVTAANVGTIRDQIRQINESTWLTFYFQDRKPFFTVQNWQVPFCVDETYFTTSTGVTVEGPSQVQSREERYDVTIGDAPVEFGQLESWLVSVFSQGVAPTPTVDYYVQIVMKGIFLRGIQG
jgi:hypothetical protein